MPPEFECLRVAVDGPIGRLELHRPERLNALSRQHLVELAEAARWFDTQRDVKVVGVTGAGRSFCAGFDLDDFADPDPDLPMREVADLGRIMAEAVTDMRALTVVGVHGRCVGGGLVLAAACDLRVAADDAVFSIPEVELGIPLAWAGIPRLVREIGPALTKELVLTCRPFSPAEAAAFGFVNRVVARRRAGRHGRRAARPAGGAVDADADGDEGTRQRRRRGDRLDGRRPARRRHPRLGAARPREPGGGPRLPRAAGERRGHAAPAVPSIADDEPARRTRSDASGSAAQGVRAAARPRPSGAGCSCACTSAGRWARASSGRACCSCSRAPTRPARAGPSSASCEPLDPRHYRVSTFAKPTFDEKRHHFLWRFYRLVPGLGGMSVFDRSWYGRVLVERVEGFATDEQWGRAYEEIVNFERLDRRSRA